MLRDDYSTERYRLRRVLDILEDTTNRISVRAHVPPSLMRNVVGFIRATENNAYSDTEETESDPPLSACVRQHIAARAPLEAMERSLAALELGETRATAEFVRAARTYIQLRREHLRADDQLFATSAQLVVSTPPGVDAVETASARRCYERLIGAAAEFDVGRSSHL